MTVDWLQTYFTATGNRLAVFVFLTSFLRPVFCVYLARPAVTLTRSVSEERNTPPRLHFG